MLAAGLTSLTVATAVAGSVGTANAAQDQHGAISTVTTHPGRVPARRCGAFSPSRCLSELDAGQVVD
jgi:hypothetical protein